jgi:hypothetical protein
MLRDFIYQHRTYKDADWALQPDLIDMLDTIMQRFVPGNPSERNRWLFEDWLPDLPSGQEDVKQREQEIEVLREQAVRDILQEQGEEGLINFGVTCKYPGFIASIAVSIIESAEGLYHLIELAISAGENGILLAGQISGFAIQTLGKDWREFLLERIRISVWTPVIIASLLIWWPNERLTWQDAIALGEEVNEEYWRRKHIQLIEGSLEDQSYQINQFIKVGRAANVFERISFQMEKIQTEELVRLFDATLSELSLAKSPEDIKRFRVSSYNMREFLIGLRKRSDLTRQGLARREYQALPLLGLLDAHGLTIHELMAEDPNFFIEIVCNVFLPAHRDKTESTEFSPHITAKAEAGYRLLEGMDKIPGQLTENKLDEEVLLRWITTARAKAKEVDRAAIADQKVGDILAHSPLDSEDGGWPHRIIRNVIEKVSSDNIDLGIRIKRYNMRGTFSKQLYEGGAQERAIASQYHGWAEISRTQWPRTAQLLETIAQEWEYEARREDEHAEQDKLE